VQQTVTPETSGHLLMFLCRFSDELIQTSHSDKINDLAFPHEYSEVFATAGACVNGYQPLGGCITNGTGRQSTHAHC
jgi:hypothetical protein